MILKAVPSAIFGYVASIVIAGVVVWLRAFLFPLPQAEASGGMAAFADFLLFGAAFSIFAIIPTIRLLRTQTASPTFWRAWSSVAVVITVTGLIAGIAYLAPNHLQPAYLQMVGVLSPLRILGAVPLAAGFMLSAIHAPQGATRKIFLGCAGIEVITLTVALLKLVGSRG